MLANYPTHTKVYFQMPAVLQYYWACSTVTAKLTSSLSDVPAPYVRTAAKLPSPVAPLIQQTALP
jgi:hypothetical protein